MKFVSDQFRRYLRIAKDFCVYKVLHADDPPHRLALGIAIGMFVTFTPFIGFQMLISVFLAWLFKANKVVGVPLVWISNPLTLFPIYYPCYVVGCKILGMPAALDVFEQTMGSWKQVWESSSTERLSNLRMFMSTLLDLMMDLAGPLGVGCLIVGLLAGLISYYASLFAIRQYRLARWGQLMPPRTTPKESIVDDSVNRDDESAKGGNAA